MARRRRSSVYKLQRGLETVYVGRTDRDVQERVREHQRSEKRFSYYTYKDGLTHDEAVDLERAELRRRLPRYNRREW